MGNFENSNLALKRGGKKMKVKRITLNGSKTAITFDTKCSKWLIKNFSADFIYAAYDENATLEESAKIASNYGQVVLENEYLGGDAHLTDTIYVTGTGEIEVQQLCHR